MWNAGVQECGNAGMRECENAGRGGEGELQECGDAGVRDGGERETTLRIEEFNIQHPISNVHMGGG